MGDVEHFLGTGDGNVGKATFLAHLLRLTDILNRGENAVLHSCEEYHGELKSLCRMDGHKHDCIGCLVIFINVGNERDFLKESGGGGLKTVIRTSLFIFHGRADKFLDMLDLSLALKSLGLQHSLISRLLVERANHLGGLALLCSHRFYYCRKCGKLFSSFAKGGVFLGILHHVVHGFAGRCGNLLNSVNGGLTNLTLRLVNNSLQTKVVEGRDENRKVGHHVLNLLAIVESHVSHNSVGHATLGKGCLKRSAKCVDSIKHRIVGILSAGGLDTVVHTVDNISALIVLILGLVENNLLTCALL